MLGTSATLLCRLDQSIQPLAEQDGSRILHSILQSESEDSSSALVHFSHQNGSFKDRKTNLVVAVLEKTAVTQRIWNRGQG